MDLYSPPQDRCIQRALVLHFTNRTFFRNNLRHFTAQTSTRPVSAISSCLRGCLLVSRRCGPVPSGLLTIWFPGSSCLNVVESDMGGTTAIELHCSGSWPTWMASVANDLNAVLKPANSCCSSFMCFGSITARSRPSSELSGTTVRTPRERPFNIKHALRSLTWANRRGSERQRRRWLADSKGRARDVTGTFFVRSFLRAFASDFSARVLSLV